MERVQLRPCVFIARIALDDLLERDWLTQRRFDLIRSLDQLRRLRQKSPLRQQVRPSTSPKALSTFLSERHCLFVMVLRQSFRDQPQQPPLNALERSDSLNRLIEEIDGVQVQGLLDCCGSITVAANEISPVPPSIRQPSASPTERTGLQVQHRLKR